MTGERVREQATQASGAYRNGHGRVSGGHAPLRVARVLPLLGLLALTACALPITVPIGGVGGKTIAAPTLPVPRLAWVGDAGHATRAAVLQLGADPGITTVYVLTGRAPSGFGGPVFLPTADHLIALERATGAARWSLDATALGLPSDEQRLSGFAVDAVRHHVLIAAGDQMLILDGATGTIVAARALPAGVSCVNQPAPIVPPATGADLTVDFPCAQTMANGTVRTVVVIVDPATYSVRFAPSPIGSLGPPPAEGISGHVYSISQTGLAVMARSKEGFSPIAELPFNVANPTLIAVERTADGSFTGYVYLAGIGAQVVALQDGVPGTPPTAPDALMASVLAQRAVALALTPSQFTSGQTLPALPGFLIAPGVYARAACFDDTPANTAGTATGTTMITALSDGTFRVDLRLDIRDDQGHIAHARHFGVAIAASGAATITTDTGDADPFKPFPPTACPV